MFAAPPIRDPTTVFCVEGGFTFPVPETPVPTTVFCACAQNAPENNNSATNLIFAFIIYGLS
ncbi:hypothetical protein D3C86_1069280 [compost metagenome]